MKWTELPAGRVQRAINTLLVAFDDKADRIVEQILSDEGVATRVADLCLNKGYEPSTSQRRAREIMGQNCFGIEEAIRHFGVSPTKQQLAYLAEVPFSEETLVAVKDTHVLVAVFPLSILDVRGIAKKSAQTLFYNQDWYDKQAFAKDKGEVGWHLVRKTPVANSTSNTWNEQQALLWKDEETPTARIVVYTMIGHFLATGERLFENIYVRCVDLGSDGRRVLVGRFHADGLDVSGYWDGHRVARIGVASARKQQ